MIILAFIITVVVIMFVELEKTRRRHNKSVEKTDQELIAEYDECAQAIANLAANGQGINGPLSNTTVTVVNGKISDLREKGRIIGNTLVSRGYEVDFSALDGKVYKKTSSQEKSVIGSAVVGGIIAGPTGAIVGAIHAADKNNSAKK